MTQKDTITVQVAENEVSGELFYCLLTDSMVHEGRCVPVYGVSVAFKHDNVIQFEKIHNVTTCKNTMMSFMNKMAEGMVFPVALPDIIEDFIA